MNYLTKSNPRGDKRKKKTVATVMVVVVLSIIAASFFSGVFSSIGALVWNGENAFSQSLRNISSHFKSKEGLIAQNKGLQDLLQSMTIDTLATDIIRQENKDLKEILGRSEKKSAILASVLRTPPFSPYDTFILDIGENKGVTVGDNVLVGGHILVGKIVEVNPSSSKAQLFSSTGKVTTVLIGNKSISVEAIGRGAGNFEMTISREVAIKKGDSIIMPDIDSILLGVVERVDADPAKTFQKVLFSSPINVQEVRWVTIVKSATVN